MNYATWQLNFVNPNYGTGPEERIAELGFGAEGAWVLGEAESGGIIMGYVTEPQDEAELSLWSFSNITQAQALDFCLAINPDANLLDNGRIVSPLSDFRI